MNIGAIGVVKLFYRGALTSGVIALPKSTYTIGGKTSVKSEAISAEIAVKSEVVSSEIIEGTASQTAMHNRHATFEAIESADKAAAKHLGAEGTQQKPSKTRNVFLEQLVIVSSLALGEAILTQPEIVGDIRKAGLVSVKWYNPHNLYALGRAGFGLRVLSSFTNTASMTMFQDYCADFFPKTPDGKITNTAALASGAVSGFFASLLTFAPAQLRDKIIVSGQVDATTNKIKFKTTAEVTKESISSIRNTSPSELIKYAKPIIIARVMRSCATFMAVSFMYNALGKTPADDLKRKLGFFDEHQSGATSDKTATSDNKESSESQTKPAPK